MTTTCNSNVSARLEIHRSFANGFCGGWILTQSAQSSEGRRILRLALLVQDSHPRRMLGARSVGQWRGGHPHPQGFLEVRITREPLKTKEYFRSIATPVATFYSAH